MYTSSHGPDALPGLSAWQLGVEGGGAVWRLNISTYLTDMQTFRLSGKARGIDHTTVPSNEVGPDGILARQRAHIRRKATYGLVLLAMYLEPLLCADVPLKTVGVGVDAAASERELVALWRSTIEHFDSDAAAMQQSDRDSRADDDSGGSALMVDIFDLVFVCGNTYAICKKLEGLLKTEFSVRVTMGDDIDGQGGSYSASVDADGDDGDGDDNSEERTDHMSTLVSPPAVVAMSPRSDVSPASAISGSPAFSAADSPRNSPSKTLNIRSRTFDTPDAVIELSEEEVFGSKLSPGGYTTPGGYTSPRVHSVTVPEAGARGASGAAGDGDGGDDPTHADVAMSARSVSPLRIKEDADAVVEALSAPTVGDGNGDIDDDALSGAEDDDDDWNDDDGSILPGDLSVRFGAASISDSADVAPSVSSPRAKPAVPPLALVTDKVDSAVEADGGPAEPIKALEPLSSYYDNIAMIFPIAYGASGPGGDAVSGAAHKPATAIRGLSARALLESMQMQGRLYEEWVDVMSDYSTVFSTDRNMASGDVSPSTAAQSAQDGMGLHHGGSKGLTYRVKSQRPEVVSIVKDVLTKSKALLQWEELPAGLGLGLSWNLLWTWNKPRLNPAHLLVWQRVNHFVDSKQLTRKDILKKNLHRFTSMPGKASDAFRIMPETYILPQEYTHFVRSFTEKEAAMFCQDPAAREEAGADDKPYSSTNSSLNLWIMKPVGMSRGRGISLVSDISCLTYSQATVVQRYIPDPMLLDGYKFDLRLYVLVTSFHPLEAFVYGDGFARVSTQRYTLDPNEIQNKFVHLTNSSIQRLNSAGPTQDNPLMGGDQDSGGSKIALKGDSGLWARMGKMGFDTDAIWKQICLLLVKSLVVVDDRMTYQPNAFEVFGYDVLIDSKCRPWLIEANASPSMSRDSALDYRIKDAMIKDTIQLVNPLPFDRAAVSRVMRRRMRDVATSKFMLGKGDPCLESDLQEILGRARPRRYGDMPAYIGEYERLAPHTPLFEKTLKLKSKCIKTTGGSGSGTGASTKKDKRGGR